MKYKAWSFKTFHPEKVRKKMINYEELVKDFLKSDKKSALIETDVDDWTVVGGLYRLLKSKPNYKKRIKIFHSSKEHFVALIRLD